MACNQEGNARMSTTTTNINKHDNRQRSVRVRRIHTPSSCKCFRRFVSACWLTNKFCFLQHFLRRFYDKQAKAFAIIYENTPRNLS